MIGKYVFIILLIVLILIGLASGEFYETWRNASTL